MTPAKIPVWSDHSSLGHYLDSIVVGESGRTLDVLSPRNLGDVFESD